MRKLAFLFLIVYLAAFAGNYLHSHTSGVDPVNACKLCQILYLPYTFSYYSLPLLLLQQMRAAEFALASHFAPSIHREIFGRAPPSIFAL